ncbi:MAG TPA: hypothetical protein VFI47_14465 [Acidimicrobiales bacterium]|nr:hypothetical protein [Acidimicrobiales bacterium]
MPFEDALRDSLRREAGAVPLPDRAPDRAVARARARRRRRTAAAGVAATTALVAALAPLVGGDGGGGDDTVIPASTPVGLPRTGPISFDWSPVDGGLSNVASSFQSDDGTVYALATAPGARWEEHPAGDVPMALYSLAADGTWQPLPLGGDRPDVMGMSTAGGLLYAIGTAPGEGGDGKVNQVSSSADGGDTWTSEDIPAPAPPGDPGMFRPSSTLAVESAGATTIAVVSTSYHPDVEALFPEAGDAGGWAEFRDEGIVLLSAPVPPVAVEREAGVTTTTTVAPAPPATDAPTTTPPSPGAIEPVDPRAAAEVVQTIPWADLGLSGPEAVATSHQVLRWDGEGWAPVDGDPLAGAGHVILSSSGDRFVARTWGLDGAGLLTSGDGVSWAPVELPVDGDVVGIGEALVLVGYEAPEVDDGAAVEGTAARTREQAVTAPDLLVKVSGDGGATWTDLDLTSLGIDPGSFLVDAASGPLGLALTFGRYDSADVRIALTGDLQDWTVVPARDVLGTDDIAGVSTVVGADKVVVTATVPPTEPGGLPGSVTAVGTPVRDG